MKSIQWSGLLKFGCTDAHGRRRSFEKRFGPSLRDKCLSCHGPDYSKKGRREKLRPGLRLDSIKRRS